MTQSQKDKKVQNLAMIGSSAGLGLGLYMAYKGGKHFWTYVGYGVLFSIIGGVAASVPARVLIKVDPEAPVTEEVVEESAKKE